MAAVLGCAFSMSSGFRWWARRITGRRLPVRSGWANGQSGGSAPGGLRRSAISFSKSSIEENDR
jgi:hypothetical protein